MLGWDYQLDELLLRKTLHTVCTAYPAPEMRARIDVLAEPLAQDGVSSRVLIALQPFVPLPESAYTRGVTVGFAEGLLRKNPRIKTANFATVRKKYVGANTNHFEQLMVNKQGEILEGVSSNFYGVQQGVLRTAGTGVLEGITRKIILALAATLNLPVQLAAIHVAEIDSLAEAAISSSSRGWLPVVTIAGHTVGNGQPGPISQQMMQAYAEFVQREAKTALE
jgi:branched-chain amino acid aminotransferase